jgi:hypothetical protein
MMWTSRHLKPCMAVVATRAVASGAAMADTAAPRAIANLLLADDMADACAAVVRRRGIKDSKAVAIQGVRALIQDGHRKQTLNTVANEGSRAEMSSMQPAILSRRRLTPGSRASTCGSAEQIAGKNDPIGRFLETVQ